MPAHTVYGTNGGGEDETDGNVYALPLARKEYKKRGCEGNKTCASRCFLSIS